MLLNKTIQATTTLEFDTFGIHNEYIQVPLVPPQMKRREKWMRISSKKAKYCHFIRSSK
jgi:hypothetical protein